MWRHHKRLDSDPDPQIKYVDPETQGYESKIWLTRTRILPGPKKLLTKKHVLLTKSLQL